MFIVYVVEYGYSLMCRVSNGGSISPGPGEDGSAADRL